MRLGIYGGSFDPVHRGHLAVAIAVVKARQLDRLELIPAASPPHKVKGCRAPFRHRLAMLQIAVGHSGEARLHPSGREGGRPGPSYTMDTVLELGREEPGAQLELLVGADMLADLPTWHRAGELVAAVTVIAFGRPGFDMEGARGRFREAFGPMEEGRLVAVAVPRVEASSTEIRRILAEGGDPADLLPPGVHRYIREMKLYRG